MKFIALEQENPGLTAADFAPHLADEARHVWAMQQANTLRKIYFDADRHNAVLVLECTDRKEALSVLNDFPLVRAGLITFTLIPLKPYDGLERLFKGQEKNQVSLSHGVS